MSVSDVAGVNVDQMMLIPSLRIRFINWFNAPTLRSLESSILILSSPIRSLDRCSTPVCIVTVTITFTKAAVLIQVLDASHLRFDASSASNNLNYISCGLTLFIPS